MSKKAGKNHNPDRPGSKNNPAGKGNDPQINWPNTTRAAGPRAGATPSGCGGWPTRRAGSWAYRKAGATGVSRPYWLPSSSRSPPAGGRSGISTSAPKTWNGAGCTGRTAGRSTSFVCRRSSPGCRRCSPAWPGKMPSTAPGSSTPAGTAWRRTKNGRTKYGRLGVQDFAKLRVIHAPHGKACAATATPGNANDSPYPRKMVRMTPDGSGRLRRGGRCGVRGHQEPQRNTRWRTQGRHGPKV